MIRRAPRFARKYSTCPYTTRFLSGNRGACIKSKNSMPFGDKFVCWGHADDTYNIDPLSRNGRVNLLQLMIGVEYPLIHRAGFKLAPRIYAGTFRENSIHPDKKDFGFRSTYELGIKNSWTLNEADVFIRSEEHTSEHQALIRT